MRIFQRFVFAFGNGQHGNFMTFAKIEASWTHQVPNVLNKQQAAVW